ncbi:MAG: transporter, partial [Candidatus Ratteibacteria bacterium]|nr:transporter [Candidatus Ratteibacteria bacterium]
EAEVTVETGSAEVMMVKYTDNPTEGSFVTEFGGAYYDLYVPEEDAGNIEEIKFRMYYPVGLELTADDKPAYWYNGTEWLPCSDQEVVIPGIITGEDVEYGGYVEVTINNTKPTSPSLSQLSGTPFALGYPTDVTSVSGGGGCFIATAAYGSYFEHHVYLLRQFRDRFLLTNPIGCTFVRWYYRHSPKYAAIIAQNEVLRTLTRVALAPLYLFALVCLKGLLPLLCLLVAGGLLIFTSRKKIKAGGKALLLLVFGLFLLLSNTSYAADTNLFKISPGEKYTVVNPTRDLVEKGKFQIDMVYSFTGTPVEGVVGGENDDLISEQSIMQAGLTYGVNDYVNISLLLPFLIDQDIMEKQNYITEDSGIGDIYLSGKIKLLDNGKECYGVVLVPFIGLETGEEDAGIGADSTVFGFKIGVDKYITEDILFAANLGYSHQDEETIGQIDIENTFLFGLSLTYILPEGGFITGEIYGRSDDGFFDNEEGYPIEAALSFGMNFENVGFILGGAAGLTEGYGATDYRVFTGIRIRI